MKRGKKEKKKKKEIEKTRYLFIYISNTEVTK